MLPYAQSSFNTYSNSLSYSPHPLGSALGHGGAARYNQLSQAINNKPFQCSNGQPGDSVRLTRMMSESRVACHGCVGFEL